jgi:hypothetical protein
VSVDERGGADEASDEQKAAFQRFLDVIAADEERREAFTERPAQTLEDAGIDASQLPPELLGFLRALSEEELALLSRVCKLSKDVGLFTIQDGVTICHL